MDLRVLFQTIIPKLLRLSLQLLLFTIFLNYFGLPAFEEYQRKEVMLVETTKDTDGFPVPAITIGVPNQNVFDNCHESIDVCIERSTFNWSALVDRVVLGYGRKTTINLTGNTLEESFTQFWSGRYFTLKLPFNIGPNDDEDQLYILLRPKYLYQIFVHDPQFFIYSENLAAIPQMARYLDARNAKGHYYRLI